MTGTVTHNKIATATDIPTAISNLQGKVCNLKAIVSCKYELTILATSCFPLCYNIQI